MDYQPLPQAFQIVEIRVENAYTKTFLLDGTLVAEPGQFVMAWLPDLEDKPFSLAGVSPVALTIAAVGPFTRAVHQRRVGDFMWVRGPFGRGYQLPATPQEDILLVGESYFMASLFFFATRASLAGHRVTVINCASTKSDLTLVEAFEMLGVELRLATGDGSAGQQGSGVDIISTIVAEADVKPKTVYASGSAGMLQAIAGWCAAQKIEVQLAWKSPMKCGLGVCGSCEVGRGWLTCVDGPVFPFDPLTTSPADIEGN